MVFTQTANKTGLPVQAVEKDLWVTAVLQMVFSLPIADHLVFKGLCVATHNPFYVQWMIMCSNLS